MKLQLHNNELFYKLHNIFKPIWCNNGISDSINNDIFLGIDIECNDVLYKIIEMIGDYYDFKTKDKRLIDF